MNVPDPPPCPYCASASYAFVEHAKLSLTSDVKVGLGNVLKPDVALLVCRGCGHLAWFLCDRERTLAELKHVDRSATGPTYR